MRPNITQPSQAFNLESDAVLQKSVDDMKTSLKLLRINVDKKSGIDFSPAPDTVAWCDLNMGHFRY